jgi:hypothetical protein
MNGEEMTINDTNSKNHFITMGRGKIAINISSTIIKHIWMVAKKKKSAKKTK